MTKLTAAHYYAHSRNEAVVASSGSPGTSSRTRVIRGGPLPSIPSRGPIAQGSLGAVIHLCSARDHIHHSSQPLRPALIWIWARVMTTFRLYLSFACGFDGYKKPEGTWHSGGPGILVAGVALERLSKRKTLSRQFSPIPSHRHLALLSSHELHWAIMRKAFSIHAV